MLALLAMRPSLAISAYLKDRMDSSSLLYLTSMVIRSYQTMIETSIISNSSTTQEPRLKGIRDYR